MAIFNFMASTGDHSPLEAVVGRTPGVEPFIGVGVGLGSNDIFATSRSQTLATIKQITAKLPVML